jgi:hypothetical protein
MYEGRVVGVLTNAEATVETLGLMMSGAWEVQNAAAQS